MASNIPHYHSTFPGEAYLNLPLPNYEYERKAIVIKLVASAFLFFIWLPRKYAFQTVVVDTKEEGHAVAAAVTEKSVDNNGSANGTSKKKKRRSKNDKPSPEQLTITSPSHEHQEILEIDTIKSSTLTLLGILSLFLTLLLSPNNLFPSRTLLRAPLLTPQECQKLVSLAERAAKRNEESARKEKKKLMGRYPELRGVEKDAEVGKRNDTEVMDIEGWRELRKLNSVLRAPTGWKKDRHTLYPTTDLNLVTDPFEPQDREWLASILDARLSPLMERAYGVYRGAIRANDIFVVRYDGKDKGSEGQDRLRKHTDSSHLSFNVLLNTEFEGGGTRFHSRIQKEEAIDIHPNLGEMLLSHAMVLHEGLPTTSGTRYILVGFNSIDEKDPLSNQSTNLSLFSSWLNFSWMQVRFREGAERGVVNRRKSRRDGNDASAAGIFSNKYIISLFRDLDNTLTWLGDKYAPLRSGKLISDDNAAEYIQTMDRAMAERVKYEQTHGIERTRANGYSSWFQGQNIYLDVFGGYADSWFERKTLEDKFKSENL